MKNFKKLSIIYLIICLLITLVGCSGNNGSATETDSTNNTNAQAEYNWKLLGVYARGTNYAKIEETYAEMVTKLSNGRIKVTYFGAGELGSQGSVFDLVQSGTVEMGGDWPGYWTGIDTAFEPLGTSMLGFSGWDFLVWYKAFGGKEICDEIYDKYGLVFIANTVQQQESGIRSNVPINSLEDFKGLQLRIGGLTAPRVLTKIGANCVTVAGPELYEAVQKGVVDGYEYGSAGLDYSSAVYETTKYWCTPGFHQTGSLIGIMVNKDAYNSLPEDLQNVLQIAGDYCITHNSCQNIYEEVIAMDAILNAGCTITKLSEEDLSIIEKYRNEVVNELCAENPLYRKAIESQIAYMESMKATRERYGIYGFGNTWSLTLK